MQQEEKKRRALAALNQVQPPRCLEPGPASSLCLRTSALAIKPFQTPFCTGVSALHVFYGEPSFGLVEVGAGEETADAGGADETPRPHRPSPGSSGPSHGLIVRPLPS